MKPSSKTKILMIATVLVLLLSTLNLSGCLENDREGIVGIPEGKAPDGDVQDDYVNASVPIMNTYREPKQIVMKFRIVTNGREEYSENKLIKLPKDSQQVYYQVVEVPKNETPDYVDTEMIVEEDEVKVINVSGESLNGSASVDATVANTKFESEVDLVELTVKTRYNEYSEKKRFKFPESSIDEYSGIVDIPTDEVPEDFAAQIT